MNSPEDNTAVIRMTKDFDEFISQNKNQSRHGGLSFNRSSIERSMDASERAYAGVSMQEIFSKEKDKQTDLLKAKSEITKLQHEVQNLNMCRKRSRIEYDQDVDVIKQNYQREVEKFSSLRHELHLITAKEIETREELVHTKRTLEDTKTDFEQKVLVLQKEKHKTELEAEETQHILRQKVNDLKSENLRKQTDVQICQDMLEESQQQHAISKKRYGEISQKLEEMEGLSVKAVNYEHKIKDLEQNLSRLEENSTVVSAMKSQIDRSIVLEKENKKLREDNVYYMETQENILILREQNEVLKQKLERMQQRCNELQQNQPNYDEMKEKLAKWQTVDSRGVSRPLSPTQMTRSISDLQNENAILVAKQGQLTSSYHSLQDELSIKERQLSDFQENITREQGRMLQLADQVKRLQKKLLLVTKEREGYKRIIDSYESEVTVNISTSTAQRLAELEQVNTSYHGHLEDLENKIMKQNDMVSNLNKHCIKLERHGDKANQSLQRVPTEADHTLLRTLRENIAELEKTVEKLKEENNILEGRIEGCNSQGNYDPTKTKVLHFSMNPHALAQQQRAQKLSILEKENERLKKRLQVLEEADGKVEDLTVVVDQKLQEPSSSKEIDGLKQQLTSAELKNKRLMEAFSKTSQEFREVCYQLLGYKIDIPVSNQYRLLSMYASSPDDCLLFQQAQNGEMQMLGTEYSHNFEENMKTYLHGANSIPAFLSSITMELFNSQTLVQ